MIHTILPVQLARHRAAGRVEPHKRLMAAVLQTVVDDCRGGSAYRRSRNYDAGIDTRGIKRAIAYVASTDRTWPFSFENLCEALGIDSNHLREELCVRSSDPRT